MSEYWRNISNRRLSIGGKLLEPGEVGKAGRDMSASPFVKAGWLEKADAKHETKKPSVKARVEEAQTATDGSRLQELATDGSSKVRDAAQTRISELEAGSQGGEPESE